MVSTGAVTQPVTAVPSTAPRRRTQAERTAATQSALLEATVDCLSELGYAATSTTEIVRRAGLSRGAQVHHFPTKGDLVVAAMERLFERRLAEFRETFFGRRAGMRNLDAAVDLLWSMFQGPTFNAWLELVVAARTDPTLKTRLAEVTAHFDDEVQVIFDELFPELSATGATRGVARFSFALLDGLAIQQLVRPDPQDAAQVLELLKMLGRLALPPIPQES
jgi:AcrR family transcriptional regulator